jgi:hypothetical protein
LLVFVRERRLVVSSRNRLPPGVRPGAETEHPMLIIGIAVLAVLVLGFFWRRNRTAAH